MEVSQSATRWPSYDYDNLLKRDTLSLDLFWINGESPTADFTRRVTRRSQARTPPRNR